MRATLLPLLLLIAPAFLLWTVGCRKVAEAPTAESRPDQTEQSPYCLVFDVVPSTPAAENRNSTVWNASYSAEGKVARFRIELATQHAPSSDKDFPDIKFGSGRFIAEPGSDAAVLLRDLKRVLEAKTMPTNVKRVSSLPFEFAILGEHQSHVHGGGFSSEPKGDWIAMKVFVGPAGDEEGEVFLNLNPALRKGEFSIKDADYGDIVLRELAKVL